MRLHSAQDCASTEKVSKQRAISISLISFVASLWYETFGFRFLNNY